VTDPVVRALNAQTPDQTPGRSCGLHKWDDPSEERRRNETPGYWLAELEDTLAGDDIAEALNASGIDIES
jgi:hypothetical protein